MPAQSLSPGEAKPRILCVDDEPNVLESLQISLRRDCEVVTATGGEQALAAIRERGPFAVIISDLRMPGMDGTRFLTLARDLDPDAVRMLLTGNADLEGAVAAINEAGVFRLLTKPCPAREIAARVAQALEHRRLISRERELLKTEVAQLSGQLAQTDRLATLGTMAAQVGHEISNALTALQGGLALINANVAGGVMPNEDDLRTLLWAKEHLSTHARHLLALGRPQAQRDVRVDLGAALRKVVKMLATAGVLRSLSISCTVPSDEPVWVRLDPTRLEQVFVNLVKNAADALGETERRDLRVTVTADGPVATCVVADNGCGIPADKIDLIFTPYYTTKPSGKGTGLGLPVVRQIVEAYGGKIICDSTVGEGTTFTVTFPRDDS